MHSCKVLLFWNLVASGIVLFHSGIVTTAGVVSNRYLYGPKGFEDNLRLIKSERVEKRYKKRRRKLELRWGFDVDVSIDDICTWYPCSVPFIQVSVYVSPHWTATVYRDTQLRENMRICVTFNLEAH